MNPPLPWRSLIGLAVLLAGVSAASEAWRAYQSAAQGRELAQLARPGDITLLSSLSCVFCERARRWLTQHQVPFTECFIERDSACAERYQALGARGTPTLLVRGQPQLGFDAGQVLARLQAPPG